MDQTPATAEDTLAALTDAYDRLTPALQVAARQIIDNPREVAVLSMRALAQRSAVHPNAFVRLARSLGFEGYEELRERFRDFMVSDSFGNFGQRAEWLQQLAKRGGDASIVAEMTQAIADNTERAISGQSIATLKRVRQHMLRARAVYVLGLGSAHSLAHQFWYVSRMAFDHIHAIPRHGSTPVDDLHHAKKGDVLLALTFQPYRSDTLAAVRLAQARGLRVIGITDSHTSPLALEADDALVCPTSTPHFFESHTAVTALLETLVALLVASADDDAQARIKRFHAERQDAGVYEEAVRHRTPSDTARGGAA